MAGIRFITAGSFIDGSGSAVRRNVFLTVQDGIITAIGPATELPRNSKAAIDSFSHCTIVPALIDCSVSLSRSPAVDEEVRLSTDEADFATKATMLMRHISYCYTHGVLGVADGDRPGSIEQYREVIAQKGIIEIRTSGRLCQNSQDCLSDSSIGKDFIKIGYSNSIDDEQAPSCRLTYEDLCRILQHKGEKKAVVVANGRQRVKEALEAGCDAIEQGYHMGENNLKKMAENGVLWIPNMLRAKNALDSSGSGGVVSCRFSNRYVAPGKADPGAEAFWKKMLAGQLKLVRLARKLRVTTAVGTGAGSVGILHGESMVEEMKLFIKAGFSLEETIYSASDVGAGFFGMKRLGRLAIGRQATFLITRGTAKQLPRKLAYLEGIYVDGVPSTIYRKNPVKSES